MALMRPRFLSLLVTTIDGAKSVSVARNISALASISSKDGACLMNSACCSGVQNPITFSTPAWLYQERSDRTISPYVGRCTT